MAEQFITPNNNSISSKSEEVLNRRQEHAHPRPEQVIIKKPTIDEFCELCLNLGIIFCAENEDEIIENPEEKSKFDSSNENLTNSEPSKRDDDSSDPSSKHFDEAMQEQVQQTYNIILELAQPIFDGKLPDICKILQKVTASTELTVTASKGCQFGKKTLTPYLELCIQNDEYEGPGVGVGITLRYTKSKSGVEMFLKVDWQEARLDNYFTRTQRHEVISSIKKTIKANTLTSKNDRVDVTSGKNEPTTEELINDPHLAKHQELQILALGAAYQDLETRMRLMFDYIMCDSDLDRTHSQETDEDPDHIFENRNSLEQNFQIATEKRQKFFPFFIIVDSPSKIPIILIVGEKTTLETLKHDLAVLETLQQQLRLISSCKHLLAPQEIIISNIKVGELNQTAKLALTELPPRVTEGFFKTVIDGSNFDWDNLFELAGGNEKLSITVSEVVVFQDEDNGEADPPLYDQYICIEPVENMSLPTLNLFPLRTSKYENNMPEDLETQRVALDKQTKDLNLKIIWAHSPRELPSIESEKRWEIVSQIGTIVGHPAIPNGLLQYFDSDLELEPDDPSDDKLTIARPLRLLPRPGPEELHRSSATS